MYLTRSSLLSLCENRDQSGEVIWYIAQMEFITDQMLVPGRSVREYWLISMPPAAEPDGIPLMQRALPGDGLPIFIRSRVIGVAPWLRIIPAYVRADYPLLYFMRTSA